MILFYAQITFMVTDVKLNTNILICHWFETKTSTHRSARRWRRARRLFRHWIWTTCSRGRCRGQRSSGSHGRRRCHRWPGARPRCALTRGGNIYWMYTVLTDVWAKVTFFFCVCLFLPTSLLAFHSSSDTDSSWIREIRDISYQWDKKTRTWVNIY